LTSSSALEVFFLVNWTLFYISALSTYDSYTTGKPFPYFHTWFKSEKAIVILSGENLISSKASNVCGCTVWLFFILLHVLLSPCHALGFQVYCLLVARSRTSLLLITKRIKGFNAKNMNKTNKSLIMKSFQL
jgi:hypothetical protein